MQVSTRGHHTEGVPVVVLEGSGLPRATAGTKKKRKGKEEREWRPQKPKTTRHERSNHLHCQICLGLLVPICDRKLRSFGNLVGLDYAVGRGVLRV
jgi:hypothetical protein